MAIAALALAGTIGLQSLQLRPNLGRPLNFSSAERQEALRLKLIERLPTLGYDNLIANWAFLSLLQYYGDDEAREVTGYTLNANYFDLITKRDPRFVEIYPYLSTGVSFYLGNPQLAVEYMTRGTNVLSPQLHPYAFLVWRYKGLDQLLLIGDTQASIRSHEMAAKWAQKSEPELSQMYRQTAEFLKQDPDSTVIRFRSWVDVYLNAVDAKVKKRAEQEIVKLGGKIERNEKGEEFFIVPQDKPASSKKP
nr:hypothetical protein [Ancylothrix sp. D3o]